MSDHQDMLARVAALEEELETTKDELEEAREEMADLEDAPCEREAGIADLVDTIKAVLADVETMEPRTMGRLVDLAVPGRGPGSFMGVGGGRRPLLDLQDLLTHRAAGVGTLHEALARDRGYTLDTITHLPNDQMEALSDYVLRHGTPQQLARLALHFPSLLRRAEEENPKLAEKALTPLMTSDDREVRLKGITLFGGGKARSPERAGQAPTR